MTDHKINIELLNFFNEAFSGMNFFNDWAEIPEIVPTGKTHKELLKNYAINPEIYKYYNRVNLFERFTEQQKYIYAPLPKHNHNLKATPYNLKICNAYYYRPNFIYKLGGIVYNSFIHSKGKEIKTLLDLKPYFLEYAKGFNEGYTSFEEQKINFINPAFTDRNDSLKRVFEFITARPTHSWGKLTRTGDNLKGYEDGLLQGYYYKAWTIVFTQNDSFTPLFKGLNQNSGQPQQTVKKEPVTILKKLFEDPEKYTKIMQILIEKKHIDKQTHYWIDEKKGNKSFLASLVKHLHTKKHLRRKPTNIEVLAICKYTFGVDISIDTIKTAKQNDHDFNFLLQNEA